MEYLFANTSLAFSQYGDFTFTGKGLKRLTTKPEVLYQNVYKFIKSSLGDYDLIMGYGANLQQHLGQGITLSLARTIERKLSADIIRQGLIPKEYLEVLSIIDGNTIFLRVILYDSEEFTINLEITNTGVIISE